MAVKFRGVLKFVFNTQAGAEELPQHFQIGMEGQRSDWPNKYDLGDLPFDTFKITDLKIRGDNVRLRLEFKVENENNMPHGEFVDAVKDDFDSLAGVDTADFYIDNAVASEIIEGGRRRTRRVKQRARKTRRRH